MGRPIWLGMLVVSAMALQGCSSITSAWYGWRVPKGGSVFNHYEATYGVTTVSKPVLIPLKEIGTALDLDVQALNFERALSESKSFQSQGFSRFQVRREAGLTASADLMALQQLAALAQSGAAPGAAPPAAPTLPAVTPLTPDAAFNQSAMGAADVSLPFRGRFQSAFNNLLLSRIGASQLALMKNLKGYDAHISFSTMTVIPGDLTRSNSNAEIRVQWKLDNPPENQAELIAIPIFPVFDAVGERDDAASLHELRLFLSLLAQYGPAQAQGQMQQMSSDLRRLVSASERVTLAGSPLQDNVLQYRVSGVRVPRIFDDRRPGNKTRMEPLVLPVVTLILVPEDAYKPKATEAACTGACGKSNPKECKNLCDQKCSGDCEMTGKGKGVEIGVETAYSSRWRRERPWWDRLPPGTFVPGFWFSRGTNFAMPDSPSKANPFRAASLPLGSFGKVKNLKAPVAPKPVEFIYPVDKARITHPFDQVLVVQAKGDIAKAFFLEGISLPFRLLDQKDQEVAALAPAQPPAAVTPRPPALPPVATPTPTSAGKQESFIPGELPQISETGTSKNAEDCPEADLKAPLPKKCAGDEKARTYAVFLSSEVVRNLAKSRGIQIKDDDNSISPGNPLVQKPVVQDPARDRIVRLSAANLAGPSVSSAGGTLGVIDYCLDFNIYNPAPLPIESIEVTGKDGLIRAIRRRQATTWPSEAYACCEAGELKGGSRGGTGGKDGDKGDDKGGAKPAKEACPIHGKGSGDTAGNDGPGRAPLPGGE